MNQTEEYPELPDEVVPSRLVLRLRYARADLSFVLDDIRTWIDRSNTPLIRYARQQAFGKLNTYKDDPDGRTPPVPH